MNKFCVLTSVLLLNGWLGTTTALAGTFNTVDFDATMNAAEQQVRDYFLPAYGMSLEEANELQRAQALIKDYRSQEAYERLQPLLEKYPENYWVQYLTAEVLLDLGNSELALQQIENFLASEPGQALTADQQFEFHRLHAQAYVMEGEPQVALRMLKKSLPSYERLSTPYKEAYFLLWSEIYLANKQPFEAYDALQKGIQSGLQSQESRNVLMELSEELSEKLYQEGLDDYDEREYANAVAQFLAAYRLNPEPIKYSQNLSRAQDRFIKVFENRFYASRSLLVNAVNNMRYAMSNRDYNNLYREYLRLQADRNAAFLLEHREYLPVNMQKALASIEATLIRQGLKIQ